MLTVEHQKVLTSQVDGSACNCCFLVFLPVFSSLRNFFLLSASVGGGLPTPPVPGFHSHWVCGCISSPLPVCLLVPSNLSGKSGRLSKVSLTLSTHFRP